MGFFDAFKKKEVVNPQQAQFQKIYSLVSTEKFGVCYNFVARRMLNATTYQMTSTLNAETKAVLEEKKTRDAEQIDENVSNIAGINNLMQMTADLFVENVRPEIVCKKITAVLKLIGTNNQIKTNITDEYCWEIEKMTSTFDDAFMRCVNISESGHKVARTMSDQAYAERTSTGLGFGVLTSNIGTAALYTVMNAHEHKRQLAAQDTMISGTVNVLNQGNMEVLYDSVMELYGAYQQDVKNVLLSVQEILTDKNKLQEAEEKVSHGCESVKGKIESANLPPQMIPVAVSALKTLYKVGKPCTISELRYYEECCCYSNQKLAATMREISDRGILKKVYNNKLYFFPALSSLEESLQQMGITEEAVKEEEGSTRPNTGDIPLDLNYEELEEQMCNCPCCHKSVSVRAVACPDCGYPIKKNHLINLYNQQPIIEGKTTKKLYTVKLWILAQYLDMPVTELPRMNKQIDTWVIENSKMFNCITESDVAVLSKSPKDDYEKIKLFLEHEETLCKMLEQRRGK